MTATGTYDPARTVIVRYSASPSTKDSGVDVVVPLVTADGTALLVNRGWMPKINQGGDIGEVPAPPSGEVTVSGYVRADGSGDSTRVADGSTRAIDSDAIGAAHRPPRLRRLGRAATRGPRPRPSRSRPVELPDLDNGPHFFYGLQWWFFGVLALIGFGWFAYDEWRGGPASRKDKRPGATGRDARRARGSGTLRPSRPRRRAAGQAPARPQRTTRRGQRSPRTRTRKHERPATAVGTSSTRSTLVSQMASTGPR